VRHGPLLESNLEPYPGYRLRRLLGRGSFGEVWSAEVAGGDLVALKFMPCDSGRTAIQEMRALQVIRRRPHPNLLRTDRIWTYSSFVVIAMELADGSLYDLLQVYRAELGTPIAPDQVCLYLGQVAAALDCLNGRRSMDGQPFAIQHCDVKPSNMLLVGDTAKLSDFGLASVVNSTIQDHRRAGTTDFAAPEVFQGRVSARTDQYSLAVTYCLLRGGRLPFPDTPATFSRHYVRPAPDLGMLPPLEQPLIARALAPAPQDRWPSCVALIDRLAAAINTPTLPPVAASAPPLVEAS
jgi:serine/threonine protein kinase